MDMDKNYIESLEKRLIKATKVIKWLKNQNSMMRAQYAQNKSKWIDEIEKSRQKFDELFYHVFPDLHPDNFPDLDDWEDENGETE